MKQETRELNKFKEDLKEFLKNRDKIVVLGIGNSLRGDDFSGSLTARRLKQELNDEKVTIIDGGSVPENFTGQIKKESPTHIILIDAADMGKTPGYLRLIEKEEISRYNISTHAMPLSFLINYLEHTTDARIILVGIQPREMELNEKISPEVNNSIHYLIELFNDLL